MTGETALTALIHAGADPNTTDRSGVTPLHRAVRTRQNTGRGGTGSPESKAQQRQIMQLLQLHDTTR